MSDSVVNFDCPGCGKRYNAPAGSAGAKTACKACGATMVVPRESLDPFADLIGFNCYLCDTRMYAPPSQVGRNAKCPDCHSLTRVPPPPAPKPKPAPVEDDNPYEVYEGEQPHGIDLARAAAKCVTFECRVCQTHLQAEATRIGEVVVCHDCGAETRVPALRPEAVRPPSLSDGEGYDLHEEEASTAPKRSLFEEYTTRAPPGFRQPDKRGKHPDSHLGDQRSANAQGWGVGLVAGLPSAFGTSGMLSAWLGLSAGLAAVVPVTLMTTAMLVSGGGLFGLIGGVLMIGTAVALSMLWATITSAILWATVDDAASGARRVQNWPALDPTEWGGPFLCLAVALCVSTIPGSVGWQVGHELLRWPWPLDSSIGWVTVGIWLTLPVVWLSQLDSSSAWGVLSPAVLRTIWHAPATWVAFYAVTFGMSLGLLGVSEELFDRIGGYALFAVCPLDVLFYLLYAWLLGRLAWTAGAATPNVALPHDSR